MECCHDGQMNFLVPCANNNRYYIPEFCEENQQFGAEKYSELIEKDKKPIVKTAAEDWLMYDTLCKVSFPFSCEIYFYQSHHDYCLYVCSFLKHYLALIQR